MQVVKDGENANSIPKEKPIDLSGVNLVARYTLDKNTDINAEIGDKSLYLSKDGAKVLCPHLSGPVTVQGGAQIIGNPCGTFCHFFNLQAHKIKKTNDKGEPIDEPTGKVLASITCGSGMLLPIYNINLKVSNPLMPDNK
jgi:hypothetical protein